MIRGFQYRFYPTPEQKAALAKTFGCARYVYNWALSLRSKAWHERQERTNYSQTSADLTELKQQPDMAWLNEVSSVPVQQSLRHLQAAFVNFWRNDAAYPSFKSKFNRQSAKFTRSGFQWSGGQLTLAKVGKLKIRWSRRFAADPSTVTVSHTPAGRDYVSFLVDEPVKGIPAAEGTIGIDLGLTCFAALSDGKARLRVAKIHQTISDIRRDDLHKLSTDLVRENQTIVVEDLNVRGMMANHALAGAIADSGWGEFVRQLQYKCEWHGRILIRIDRFYPSSKLCSACGFKNDSMPLDVREWQCPGCGMMHDRDINAARNVLAAGLAERENARGDGVRPKREQSRRRGCRGSGNRLVRCA